MTVIYDPHHSKYLDEADTREELARVFNVCNQCRKCVALCPTFPSLFALLSTGNAEMMTPAQQDAVSSQCHQCKMCEVQCPYTPARHESAIDFPRLMLRAAAMRRSAGLNTWRTTAVAALRSRTETIGAVAVVANALTAKSVGTAPRALLRKATQVVAGVSHVRLLPKYARVRFSTWFHQRAKVRLVRPQGNVSVYPTCMVEYHEPAIGRAMVKVYEHNGIECSLSAARCCGSPLLRDGDVRGFVKVAVDNVALLAEEVKRGNSIVVPQATCSYVLKHDYVDYVGGPEAKLVADNTHDACEYLLKVHNSEGMSLDTRFSGVVPKTITYHSPCHLRAQKTAHESRDVLKLTGARVKMVEQCAGGHGASRTQAQSSIANSKNVEQLVATITAENSSCVAGDCHLANTAIGEQTNVTPLHPLQVLAEAYGLVDTRDD